MYRIAILVCCIYSAHANRVRDNLRILGGIPISIEKAPYQVSIIEIGEGHKCGGSIISPNHILTAGHCASLNPSSYHIRAGSNFSQYGGDLHEVSEIIRHEDFEVDDIGVSSDIAIMKVASAFNIDGKTKKVVSLAEKNDTLKIGNVCLITGWGVNKSYRQVSTQLLGLKVRVIDFEECKRNYQFLGGEMHKNIFCAEYPTRKKDFCYGDSGGPLVLKGKQAGIISWSGPGCAQPGRPGVYVDVAKYRDWIDKHIQVRNLALQIM